MNAQARAGRVLTSAFLAILLTMTVSSSAVAARSDCAKNKNTLADIDKSISQLEAIQMPGKMASDMVAVIDQLLEGLKATKKDLGKITGPNKQLTGAFKNAKEQLGEIGETMDTLKVPRPKALVSLTKSLGVLQGDIEKGIKKYQATAPGKVAAGLDKASKTIGGVIDQLEAAKTALEGVKAIDDAAHGTGAEQIRAMKYGFDQLKGKLGVDEVPGLGAFLDAYSEAMDGIASNVDIIEKTTKERLAVADTILRDAGFSGAENLYTGLQSPREKLERRLQALRSERNDLVRQLEEDECATPDKPTPNDPCATGTPPDKARAIAEAMTRKEREAYDDAQMLLRDRMGDLATHSFQQPTLTPSPEEAKLSSQRGKLDLLKRAAVAKDRSRYAAADPLDEVRAIAQSLGVALPVVPNSMRWEEVALQYAAAIEPVLAKRERQLEQKAQSDLAAKRKAWQATNDKLLASAKQARTKRDAAKSALDKALANALNREMAAKNWSQDQRDRFDECFPEYGKVRKTAAAAPAPSAARPPAAKPAAQPAAQPATPRAPAPAPQPKQKECDSGGGLAGAMGGVACEISK